MTFSRGLTRTCREQPPAEFGECVAQRRGLLHQEPVREHREPPRVPVGAFRGCQQPGLPVTDRGQRAERPGQPAGHLGRRGVDQHVDGELPALRQVLLKDAQRVQSWRRRERAGQRPDGRDPVDAQHPPGIARVRPAQQVPAAVPQYHRPRVDLHLALDPVTFGTRAGVGIARKPVAQPQPPPARAGLEQRGGQFRADTRRGERVEATSIWNLRGTRRDVADGPD